MDVRLWSRVWLVVVSAAVLQVGVFSHFRTWNVGADVLLLVAVSSAMVVGEDRGAITGFGCGLLLDLLTHSPFGLYALTYSLVGYLLGRFETMVVRSSKVTVMFTGFVGTVLGMLGYGLLGELVGVASPSPSRLGLIAVVAGAWNALLTPLAVRAMRWAWRQPAGPRLAFSTSTSRLRR